MSRPIEVVVRFDYGSVVPWVPGLDGALSFVAGPCSYEEGWSEQVRRSLLTLKALTYAPSGGIVAEPTTAGYGAEEYDPVSRRLVGNFPQAFSRVAVVTPPATCPALPASRDTR